MQVGGTNITLDAKVVLFESSNKNAERTKWEFSSVHTFAITYDYDEYLQCFMYVTREQRIMHTHLSYMQQYFLVTRDMS